MPHQTMILMEGAPASCTKLQPHCTHPESGQYVRKACPQTCGVCAEKVVAGGAGDGGSSSSGSDNGGSSGGDDLSAGGRKDQTAGRSTLASARNAAATAAVVAIAKEMRRAAKEFALLTETKPISGATLKHTAGAWRSVGRKVAWGASGRSAPEATVHIRSGPSSAADSATAAAKGLDLAAAAADASLNNVKAVKPHPPKLSSVPHVAASDESKNGGSTAPAKRLLRPPPRVI